MAEREYIALDSTIESDLVREETFQGRKYLVAPVVALVEGVVTPGNIGRPELALMKEFKPSINQWNGLSAALYHPKDEDGQEVSANSSPEIYDQFAFGLLFNARIDGDKLKLDAFLDMDRAEELGGEYQQCIEDLQAGTIVEVSTGLFSRTIARSGTFKGNKYEGVWQDIVPDHLAFLPNAKGACSAEMGCGAPRLNSAIAKNSTVDDFLIDPQLQIIKDQLGLVTNNKQQLRTTPNTQTTAPENACKCSDKLNCHCDHNTSSTVSAEKSKFQSLKEEALKKATPEQRTKIETAIAQFISNSEGISDSDLRASIQLQLNESGDGYGILIAVYNDSFVYVDWWSGKYSECSYTKDEKGNVSFDLSTAVSVRPMTQYLPIQTNSEESNMSTNAQNAQNNAAPTLAPAAPKALTLQEALEQMTPDARATVEEGQALRTEKLNALTGKIMKAPGNKFSEAQLKTFSREQLENIAGLIPVDSPAPAPTTNAAPTNEQPTNNDFRPNAAGAPNGDASHTNLRNQAEIGGGDGNKTQAQREEEVRPPDFLQVVQNNSKKAASR